MLGYRPDDPISFNIDMAVALRHAKEESDMVKKDKEVSQFKNLSTAEKIQHQRSLAAQGGM
jgi:hypothetical protein